MRIIVTGDRFWVCNRLAAGVLRRLIDRYAPHIIIVHGAATGVDQSFDTAAKGLGIPVEAHPAAWDRPGPVRNQEMVDAGASVSADRC
jgi:hypothetical protein